MLDDLKYIHTKDQSDSLGIAAKQWEQLSHVYDLPDLNFQPENIIYAGMGGSALAARLALSWPGFHVPFEICSQYHIPAYMSDKTLFICSSYSGNTEEEISTLAEAEATGAKIVVLAGGGRLKEFALEKNHLYVELPHASQPRYAVLYAFKALITILERAGLVHADDAEKQIHETSEFLRTSIDAWLPTVPTKDNPAKSLAREIVGTTPVIYGGPLMFPAAYKWKISFNENAKNVAWCGQYSEFNHNEFIGWSSHPIDKPYTIIDLRSNFEHPQIQKRFEISAKLLSGKRPAPHVIQVKGETLLEQLLWSVAFGDFVTLYLALLNGLDPTPVDLIEKFKKELAE